MGEPVQSFVTEPAASAAVRPSRHGPLLLQVRLAVLFFLVYLAPGAVLPLFSLRLTKLDFTPLTIGIICATQALGAILSPPLIGQIADRWFPAERCLSVCALLGGLLLWWMAELTEPTSVFFISLAFWLCMAPMFTLATSLCLAHLENPERGFGRIRLWGTIGWMTPGLLLGYWFTNPDWLCWGVSCLRPSWPRSELPDAFRLAGCAAFLVALWALTIPPTPPRPHAAARWAPLAALKLFRQPSILVLWLCVFGVCVTFPFSSQVTPLLLAHLGVPNWWLAPTLTLSQVGEVVILALLPAIQMGLGTRRTLLLGLASWFLVLVVLALGGSVELVIGTLPFNGLVMGCFVIASQIHLNSRASADIRVSADSLLTLVTGVGMAIGHLLVGWVRHAGDGSFLLTYGCAALIAAGLVVICFAGFRDDSASKPNPDLAPDS